MAYRVFSLTWPASMQIYWNKRKRLHKKRVQFPQDWFGTQTWLPFHCFGTQIWPPWRHVKTHNSRIIFNSLSPGIKTSITLVRASDISRGRGPAKFRYFREIPRNSPKKAKYHEIRQKYFQIHVGKTYLILILAIRPVLFTPNVQIYLETSSLQRVNNVPKLPGVFRWTLRKTGH